MLEDRVYGGALTGRGGTRVHRIAWTVADLRGADRPDVEELDVALRLRMGDPLMLRSLAAQR
jgi:magnesium chelatase family protein